MARKDRDMPDGVRTPASFSNVDERDKIKQMQAYAAQAAKTPEELMIEKLNAQIAKSQATAATLEKSATELGALNPSAMTKAAGESNAQFLARKQAAEAAARQNAMAENPLLNKAVKPTDAPAGKYYAWIGGTNTGQWQLYDIPGYGSTRQGKGDFSGVGGPGAGGSGNNAGAGATTYTASDGRVFTDLNAYNAYVEDLKKEEKRKAGQSAYDLLVSQFSQYGLGSLVEDVKKYIQEGLSQSELTLRLRTESKAYQKRFAANAQRIAKGLSALNEAEYIGLEDQYQNIMREYGLPASYYAKGELGVQAGFEKLLANDVSSAELEDRVMTAQSRVLNANPEVLASLKQFYPGITDGDILAYTLDPEKALTDIKRKVTAAEIGGAAMQAGLKTGVARAEELGAAGVTKQQAQQGFQTVAEIAPRGGQLAEIYKQDPYTQTTAEAEVFGVAGSTEAARQRKKLTSLETAAFSGSAGAGAIARDRAGVL